MCTLILFDVDGTLVDTGGAGRRAMECAFREILGIDGLESANGVEFAGRTDPVILESVATAVGVSPQTLRASNPRLIESFLQSLTAEMARPDPRRRTLPGVLPLLEELEARSGVYLGLVTGNIERGARIKLEPFGLNRFFPTGGFASDAPDRPTIAKIARDRAAQLTGIDFRKEAVTVVGDTRHDVDCARANGFRSVAVPYDWTPRQTLEDSFPDHLLESLTDQDTLQALGIEH